MMRVKTEAQREAVLRAATEVFREVGYDRASMNAVSNRLGGSKSTIYNYFTSKEDLFSTVMLESARNTVIGAFEILTDELPVDQALMAFGISYLKLQLSREMLEITRLTIAEGRDGKLGSKLYAEGIEKGWARVAAYLESRLPEGRWLQGGARVAAMQFKALMEDDVIDRRLRGVVASVADSQIELTVGRAVEVFMRAYASNEMLLVSPQSKRARSTPSSRTMA